MNYDSSNQCTHCLCWHIHPCMVHVVLLCYGMWCYVYVLAYRTQEIQEKEAEQTAALQQDLRDMEFFIRTSQEMAQATPAVQSDVREGTVLIGEGSSNNNKSKSKKGGGSSGHNKKNKKKRWSLVGLGWMEHQELRSRARTRSAYCLLQLVAS